MITLRKLSSSAFVLTIICVVGQACQSSGAVQQKEAKTLEQLRTGTAFLESTADQQVIVFRDLSFGAAAVFPEFQLVGLYVAVLLERPQDAALDRCALGRAATSRSHW
jgi:hypothetical protein